MSIVEKSKQVKWEISIIELEKNGRKKYKVTRLITELSVADTKIFNSKEEAKKQFEEWLK